MDLLDPKDTDLPIREDADKNILIPGLAEKEIHNFDEFKAYFGPASNNRYSNLRFVSLDRVRAMVFNATNISVIMWR